MGVLNHLIAPKSSRGARRRPTARTPRTPLDRLLVAQIEALGFVAGVVPASGPTGSAWSRAYVLGAACASLQGQERAPVSDHECFDVAIAAFAALYGAPVARDLLAATIAAAEAQEPEVEDGLLQGASDLALLLSGDAAAACAFATRNREEAEAI